MRPFPAFGDVLWADSITVLVLGPSDYRDSTIPTETFHNVLVLDVSPALRVFFTAGTVDRLRTTWLTQLASLVVEP